MQRDAAKADRGGGRGERWPGGGGETYNSRTPRVGRAETAVVHTHIPWYCKQAVTGNNNSRTGRGCRAGAHLLQRSVAGVEEAEELVGAAGGLAGGGELAVGRGRARTGVNNRAAPVHHQRGQVGEVGGARADRLGGRPDDFLQAARRDRHHGVRNRSEPEEGCHVVGCRSLMVM